MYEGTFSDFGSYHQCKDVKTQTGGNRIGSMYCTIKLKPLLPARPRFHNIHEQIPLLEPLFKDGNESVSSGSISTKTNHFILAN